MAVQKKMIHLINFQGLLTSRSLKAYIQKVLKFLLAYKELQSCNTFKFLLYLYIQFSTKAIG